MQLQELTFQVNGLAFAAQAWGNPEHFPVLALHGWLDNSASFFALAPLLNNVYLVAIDMAGHGHTNHRLGSFPYNIWEDVAEIFTIADQLGWQKFSLLGHSRGGIIATLAAGTFPERISCLSLIEGVLPELITSEDTPKQLALSIRGMQTQSTKNLSVYPDVATAINARERGMFPLGFAAAKALTERGLKKIDEQGYCWSTDSRLLIPSSIKLLPEQMAAFIARIECPIALILADEGMPKIFPHYEQVIKSYSQVVMTKLSGGHHLHMEQEVELVADVFNVFYTSVKM